MPATRSNHLSHRFCLHLSLVPIFAFLIASSSTLLAPSLFASTTPVPYIDIVSPVSVNPGTTGVTLTVLGTGFVSTSAVKWNAIPLTTTFVSSKKLTAAVPDSFVAAVGLGSITVVSPGNKISNVIYFPVEAHVSSISFSSTPSSSVSVGTTPQGIATADLDGDGKIDLAVANNGANTVSILLGNGDGTFTTKSTPSAGSGANWITVGDFNEDGKLDLAVANLSSTGSVGVSILLGNGDGTYVAGTSLTSENGPFAITAADFNHDGHLDLAVTNSNSNTVTVFLGHGDGTFATGVSYAVGTTPQVIVVGDFNEDGFLDLAVSNEEDNTVSVLLGVGDGTFGTQAVFATGGSGFPIGLIAADFNGDNHLDLAAVNESDAAILLGNGAGSFTLHANPGTGSTFLIAGVTGDFNGDGILDLFVSDQVAGEAFFLPGTGGGNFGTSVAFTTAAGAFGVATADFNGDGALDLAVSNGAANNVSIFLQQLPVSLAPTSLAFGNQAVGVPSSPAKTVTLTNSSGGTLHISAIAFTGTDSTDFSRGGTCAAGTPVNNGGTCTITITFTPAAVGARNATLSVTDDAGNSPQTLGLTGTGTELPPTITKAFGAASIPLDGTTSLTFTIANPVANTGSVTGISFTDTFPAGLLISTPNGQGGTCAGTIITTAGTNSVSLSGTTLAASASCTLIVNVVGITAGAQANTSGAISANETGAGATSNTATVTVIAPATITKVFGAASIPLNGATTLSFTITNPNAGSSLSAVNFGDTFPSGMVVASPNAITGGCPSGSIFASAGSGSVIMSGATLAASASCTFGLNVTGTTAGTKNNVSGGVGSTEGGVGTGASASLNVVAPPSIAKAFGTAAIPLNGSTSLTFTVTNPSANAVGLTGVAFTDSLPAGIVVAAPNGLANTCGGTATAVAASGTVSLSGAAIAASSSCTLAVNVTGTTAGAYTNVTNAVSATNGGTGNTASANLTVAAPPAITKAFGAASVPLNGSTSLSFTITNPNSSSMSGLAFTDSLPAGLVVATPNGLSSTCGGTATAAAASGSVSLASGTLAVSASCALSVNVTGTTAGVKNNSVAVTSTEGGAGNTSNASLTVVSPPVIVKAFGAASIPLNGSTSLSFTVQNNNTTQSLSGISFTDTIPAGLAISTPNGQIGTCGGGTITATQGTNVISLSGATLAASSSCTFSSNVIGTAAGQHNNTTGAVTSTEGGTGGTASASVIVEAPPTITKAFGAASIALNASTSLTITLTNPSANTQSLTGVAVSDSLPVGVVVATPNGLVNTCGGTPTAVAASGTVSLTAVTITTGSNCTLAVNVTGTTSGSYTNTTGAVSSTNGGTGSTASANLIVVAPPAIVKSFGAATIPLNGATSLSFTITNPNSTAAFTGLAFTDTLPAGLVVATPNSLTNTCGGTAAAVAGSGTVSLATGTLAANSSCAISVNVRSTTVGVKNNSVAVTSTEGGAGNTSNASLTIDAPPTLVKAFGAASVPLNGSTSLTFTLNNPNATSGLTGIGFTDALPAGLVVATPNGLANTCGGTTTAVAGTGTISLSGATLASSASCNFAINVTGITAGAQNNTTGAVTSTEGGTGTTASASLAVEAPPTIAKAFGTTGIALNGSTSLTLTLTNPSANTQSLTGVAVTDTLPTGIVVATPNALVNTCGGTATAVAASGTVSLTGGAIATSGNCTLTVNVTGTASGSFTNTTGAVSSTNGGTGSTASANLSVATPPTIAKSFGAATIPLNGSTSLSFAITNPGANSISLTGVGFTDSLPAGLLVATPNGLTGTCGGGTITATAASASVALSAATLAANASCNFTVNVTGTTAGAKNNSVTVTSTNAGNGNTSNASLTVVAPPALAKAFGAASIPLNGSTSLTFTVTNPSAASSLSGIAFTDALPSGLAIATPNGLTGMCGGGTITATAGSGGISLSAATLAASTSCNFSVNVTGITAGSQVNTTGAITSNEGGTGATANATLAVVAPPFIAKAFGAASIALNASTSLTLTFTNPAANTQALTGVAATDALPSGIVVATPNGLTNTCGGIPGAVAGSGTVSITGVTLAVNTNCVLTVNITGTASGNYTNITGAVSSTNGGTGNTASANLAVATPPMITKAFGAATIPLNGSTTLSFTISNPSANAISLSGVGFTDSLPAGLLVATPNGLTGTCGGGIITATAGSGSATLSAATLAANASCNFGVNVTGTTAGAKNNSVTVTSTTAGTGNTSNASLTVEAPPTLTKSFGAASVPLNGSTTLTFNLTNPNATTSLSAIGFTDTFPAGLVVAAPNGLTNTCGGTITATAGASSASLSGETLAASASCNFSINVTGTIVGTLNNTTGAVTSTEGGTGSTASASLAVLGPPSIAKSFGAASILPGGTTSLTLTITNPPTNTQSLTGVAVTDALPAGIVVATPNALANTCGGAPIAAAGSASVSLTAGTVAPSSSCTLSVNVTATASGALTNTTNAVTSTNGGTGNAASANLTVGAPPAITSANNATFTVGVAGSFTITTSGAPVPTITESGALPSGVTFIDNGNGTATLGGTPLASGTAGIYTITFTVQNGFGTAVTQTFTLTIAKGTSTITWAAPSAITFGTPLSATQLDATASVPGAFVYTPASGTVPTAGAQTLSVTFTPTDSADFTTATATVALTVNKAAPTITWAAPAAINYGTALSATQLDATASVAGTFVYIPAVGVVLNAGMQTLAVTLTPTDAADYLTATAQVSLTVNPAPTTTVVISSAASTNLGASVTFTATVTSTAGTPPGSVTFLDGSNPLGTVALTAGAASFSTSTLTAGAHSISATYSGSANFGVSSSTVFTQTIVAPDFTLTPTTPMPVVQSGQSAAISITVTAIGSDTGTVQFSVVGLPPKTTATFSPAVLTLGVNPTVETLTIITTPRFDYLSQRLAPRSRMIYAGTLWFPLAGLVIGGAGFAFRRNRKGAACLLLLFLLAGSGLLAGCAGMGTLQNAGTPAGTYSLTVTATATTPSGTTTHMTVVTLIVR